MTMASDRVINAALKAYPELELLLYLDAAGWHWMPPPLDDEGRVVEIHGVRTWPGDPDVDALRIRSSTDGRAIRMGPDGALTWEREGTLADVVEALIGLPPPSSPFAPRLVIGSAPSDWQLPY